MSVVFQACQEKALVYRTYARLAGCFWSAVLQQGTLGRTAVCAEASSRALGTLEYRPLGTVLNQYHNGTLEDQGTCADKVQESFRNIQKSVPRLPWRPP